MDTLPSGGNPEPAGTYQVWHRRDDGYAHAFNVECGNLLGALVLPAVAEGAYGSERVTRLIEGERGTTFGDVIVDPENRAYELYKHEYGAPAYRETEMPRLSGREVFHQILSGKGGQKTQEEPEQDHQESKGMSL